MKVNINLGLTVDEENQLRELLKKVTFATRSMTHKTDYPYAVSTYENIISHCDELLGELGWSPDKEVDVHDHIAKKINDPRLSFFTWPKIHDEVDDQ